MNFQQIAALFGGDDDPHLGDDAHALHQDEQLDDTDYLDDLDDDF
ncbi:hypothetical protein ACQP1V_42055 [Microtetraspora malaysiensis]